MPQLDFVESPPLHIAWRPTTPSRSCLFPVTADVVTTDQIGCDWVSMTSLTLLLCELVGHGGIHMHTHLG